MDSLVYGLVTAGTTMAGGLWLASQPRKWLTEARLAGMMALGGGLLLAVLCFELLPEAVAHGGSNAYRWLFAGLMTVLLFERYVAPRLDFLIPQATACSIGHAHDHIAEPCHDHAHELAHVHDHAHGHDHAHDHTHSHGHALLSHGAACSALGCLLVCTFFDGVAMAAGFSVNVGVGLIVAIGLIFHMLPEGVLASTVMLAAGSSAGTARRAAVAVGVAFMLGMAVPMALGGLMGSITFALPLAAGVLLYVVLAQLLPVAMRTAQGMPLMMAGALFFGLVSQLFPHAH